MTRWLGALVLLAGCQEVFSLDHVGPSEAGIDVPIAPRLDASTCAMPVVFDAFESGTACSSWGYPFGTAALANGDLVLLPDAMGSAGCVSQVPFPFGDAGIFIAVDAVGTGPGQYNSLVLFWDTGLTQPTSIQVQDGGIAMVDRARTMLGSGAYDPVAMRWIRLRPSFDRTEVIGETSPDGIAWKELGHEPRTAPATIRAQLQSGSNSVTSATAMRVASFDVCP
jgi:hypothetical protein